MEKQLLLGAKTNTFVHTGFKLAASPAQKSLVRPQLTNKQSTTIPQDTHIDLSI